MSGRALKKSTTISCSGGTAHATSAVCAKYAQLVARRPTVCINSRIFCTFAPDLVVFEKRVAARMLSQLAQPPGAASEKSAMLRVKRVRRIAHTSAVRTVRTTRECGCRAKMNGKSCGIGTSLTASKGASSSQKSSFQ